MVKKKPQLSRFSFMVFMFILLGIQFITDFNKATQVSKSA